MGNLDANWDIDEMVRLLRIWAQRARVITFDRRGFGISDRPGTPGQMAIEKLAEGGLGHGGCLIPRGGGRAIRQGPSGRTPSIRATPRNVSGLGFATLPVVLHYAATS